MGAGDQDRRNSRGPCVQVTCVCADLHVRIRVHSRVHACMWGVEICALYASVYTHGHVYVHTCLLACATSYRGWGWGAVESGGCRLQMEVGWWGAPNTEQLWGPRRASSWELDSWDP